MCSVSSATGRSSISPSTRAAEERTTLSHPLRALRGFDFVPSNKTKKGAAHGACSNRSADANRGRVVSELAPAGEFFYAEEYHQQYLHKVPNGYCGLQGTGVVCTIGDR